ncbi:MAG TPA: hypothetical protein VFO01_05865 [Trebonia sp.]|nr:hypothetical protein [Trebonia sp.]
MGDRGAPRAALAELGALGSAVLLLGLGENLFGLLARGDGESQFVSMHSDDMLFTEPFFFHLFSPANFTADLAIDVALRPCGCWPSR